MGDVEIKISYADAAADHAREVLGPGPDEGRHQRIYFAEAVVGPKDPLPVTGRGLIVRYRAGAEPDVTLKLRGPEGCLDEKRWSTRADGWGRKAKLEGDWTGSRHLISASLTRKLDDGAEPTTIRDVIDALSTGQQELVAEWLVPLETCALLGPVDAHRRERDVDGVDGPCDVEFWTVPGGLRFLEVSVRVGRKDGPATQAALTAALTALGLPPGTASTTKTEDVMRALMP